MPDEPDTIIERAGPFGTPDGARAPIDDLLNHFVTFPSGEAFQGLATRADDLTARVIVGRKGSGKTAYLTRLRAHASTADDLYADRIQGDLPSTADIVAVCQLYDESTLTEAWSSIWKRAILRSVVSHLLFRPQLSQHVVLEHRDLLETGFDALLTRRFRTPLSIYSQLIEIVNTFPTRHKLDEYLHHPEWAELEYVLGEVLRDCPPVCLYLDAIDDEYAHAPMYWLRCQKGLFYQVMKFLRDSSIGGRLHIIICIRDVVFSSVLRSEHALRYRNEPHVRVLDWDVAATRHFLREKLAGLPAHYFPPRLSKGSRTVDKWLGVSTIRNEVRSIDEPIEGYLLRHTRLIPRDLVTLGNLLCDYIARERRGDQRNGGTSRYRPLDEESIREAVSRASRWFGHEQLQICANQIASDSVPRNAARQGYSDFYIAGEEYSRGLKHELSELIRMVGADVFGPDELESMRVEGEKTFGEQTDALAVLWQNGLIGFASAQGGAATFYSAGGLDSFHLPLGEDRYVFHPCLIETVGLRPVGTDPVRPAPFPGYDG